MWRHKPTNVVCGCKSHEGIDWEPVVVIPAADWARLVELIESFDMIELADSLGPDNAGELHDIIKKVQP